MKKRKLYKKLLILLVLINQYTSNSKELASKIEEQENYKKELVAEKNNVNSKEYIEQMAREKLDMYYPNEKVYVDKGM